MDKRKLYGTIIGVVLFIILVAGATYAYFAWTSTSSQNTDVNLTIKKGLESMIVYNQGESILEVSGEELNVSSDYTTGINATIEFWKKPEVSMTIYGQIYLELLKLLSASGTTNANIAKSNTVKWVITTYNVLDPTEVFVRQGTFYGKAVGDKWEITDYFELNDFQTYYKIYLWVDINALDKNYPVESELISTEISAFATDTR